MRFVWGHMLCAHEAKQSMSHVLGPIFRINMGVKSWVIISDRHIAHDLLANKGAVTAERPFHFFMIKYYALNGRGMTFTSPDQRWKRSRAAESFSWKGVEQLADIIESEADRVVEQLQQDSTQNGSVNMVEHAQFMSLNIILRLCFGIRAKSVSDPLFKSLVYTVNTTVKLGAPGADLGTFLPALSKIIDIAFRKEDQMIDFIYKCRNPLFHQLIQEARDKDIDCLTKYLYSIKENNEFEDDDILLFLVAYKDYFIPKGTVIMANTYSLCRNPNAYNSPKEFKPERFLEDLRPLSISIKAPAESRENYMFGWGRQCPGVHLAEVELFNVWVRILATMTTEPGLDENGRPVYPNLIGIRDTGLNVVPLESQLRFIKRPVRLL
ncbi:cytochrome P450 [Fennellomyces sp. T-0311]|nr:cytochrome P450 [Fennellomyces sp. T-0311]